MTRICRLLFLLLLCSFFGCDRPERPVESYGTVRTELPTLSNSKQAHQYMQGDHEHCVFKEEDFF
ncbi:MAG TPA: hypothetical protein DEB39_15515 [Planctomycetaceae bacterium]|nr:hypothetical protein [Planctomycetaceae bacterium]